jgi:hypothetical protein
VIDRVTQSFSPAQLRSVVSVPTPDDVAPRCQQNFNGYSECFAAVVFNTDISGGIINYTIRADAGLFFVDVKNHKSDFEKRILPVQWAVDEVQLTESI